MKSKKIIASIASFLLVLGLIALIFWPSVRSFRTKANQSEAKIKLAAVHGLLQAYHSEYGSYSFKILKRDLELSENSNYVIGIPFSCAKAMGISEADAVIEYGKPMSVAFQEHRAEVIEFLRSVQKQSDCPNWKNKFEVFAVGFFARGQGIDVWKMNEAKEIVNELSGL